MTTRRKSPRVPGPARRVLAAAGVAATVLLNVWAVALAGDLETSTGGRAAPAGISSSAPQTEAIVDAKGVVRRGDGTFTVLPVTTSGTPAPGAGATSARPSPTPSRTSNPVRVVRYTVEVEGGLPADKGELARVVSAVLTDPRGWQTRDIVRFVNVSPAETAKGADVDVRVTLASPDTTDRLCAPLETRGEVSCHNGGRAVLNLRRWYLGVEGYGSDLTAYRTYLVNHEVGHALGHGHVGCPGAGQDAPVMMQQTYGLDGCVAWPWPTART
jgi:hypothetical protein